ncbi:MAG: hypothetical protein SNI51_07020 [Rikenellaceae bacterium]
MKRKMDLTSKPTKRHIMVATILYVILATTTDMLLTLETIWTRTENSSRQMAQRSHYEK